MNYSIEELREALHIYIETLEEQGEIVSIREIEDCDDRIFIDVKSERHYMISSCFHRRDYSDISKMSCYLDTIWMMNNYRKDQ